MHIISSLERGGAQAVLYDLVTHLKKRGYEQTVIYMHDGPYHARFAALGIAMHKIGGLFTTFDPICFARLVTLMRAEKPDCVHTVLWAANWLGRAAARLLSIPYVASLHNNYDQNGAVRVLLDQLVSYKSGALIAVSQEVKQSFVRAHETTCPVSVIPNGIDIHAVQAEVLSQKKTRAQLELAPDDFVIGSVGRFHSIKRYDFLLTAFAKVHTKHPQARLLLIGSGEQEAFLRAYADQLQIAPYVRWVSGQSAHGYYSFFDCFVLSSKKEGISIALLEAMSMGIVPIVTYHIAQHPVIENKCNGYVANAYKTTDLARKIVYCLTGQKSRLLMGKNAQRTVRDHFAVTAMIAAYDRMFRIHTGMQT